MSELTHTPFDTREKVACVICGSRRAGLIRDPKREDDYICAECLFRERDDARAELARLRGLMGDVADELEIQGVPCYGIREKLREAAKGEK